MASFIYFFNKYLSSANDVPSTILYTEVIAAKETNRNFYFHEMYILIGGYRQ